MKHARVYHLLRCHGHSGDHAMNIIVSARRKDQFALRWIRRIHATQPRKDWITRYRSANPLAELRAFVSKIT